MKTIHRTKPIDMGRAGDSPAPVGDPPTGTAEVTIARRPSSLARGVAAVPSGESTDGTGGSPLLPQNDFFTTLHSFTAIIPYTNDVGAVFGTNSDGIYPTAGLILLGNTLYGTAQGGGSSGNGTVFAINTDGSGFTTLHSFTATIPYTNDVI